MNIVPVRAFSDNYIWLLVEGRHAAAVDPGDAAPVLDYLQRHGLLLCGILVTHRHDDHVGGVTSLLSHRKVPVYAPRNENLDFSYLPVGENDTVTLPELSINLAVLDVPGHTARHVAYYGGKSLFCGDTLFGCGCGRVFDGSCDQLYRSLQKLAELPDDTKVYCAHEYTLANIRFARSIDPDNPALMTREQADRKRVEQDLPTIPSTIAMEKTTNPFLRCHDPIIRKAATAYRPTATAHPEEIFCAIRELKNHY